LVLNTRTNKQTHDSQHQGKTFLSRHSTHTHTHTRLVDMMNLNSTRISY
jgi:hypothetical protein